MKSNYTDSRGTITDLLVTPEYAVTQVTFTNGAVRGNHYHKETKQIDVITYGKLLCRSKEGKIVNERIVQKGDVLIHNPNVAHAYKALESAELVTTCIGPRKGEDYEIDTFKLETPLI
jgi:quercetin dioxygenase-like cupin family protein